MGSIETMISSFLRPLQFLTDETGRVHCLMNLNTETGRLSARKPNLQNQPSAEKDRYDVRRAFQAETGNTLVVAGYGQLELRLLAHMTGCESMLSAFEAGGDFHTRTAVGMFPYIRDAIEKGEVLLEWDYANGPPPVPMVKEKYSEERRKGKILNFSIAYGKTVYGLAVDWGVSKEEAQQTVDAWYADRPEVREWQQCVQREAREHRVTRTLLGRQRPLQ